MADVLSPQALSRLIGSIYDCALDPSRWEPTMGDIADAFRCMIAQLHLNDLRRDRLLISKSIGIDEYWAQRQLQYLPEVNAALAQALAAWPSADLPFVFSRHVPPEVAERSPYVTDCLKPQGICDIMQFFLLHTPTRLAGFGMSRHERYGLISEDDIEAGRLLIPHLRRAVTISDLLDIRTIERARMAEAFDALRCAVILTNERGMILHANHPAEQMLRDGGPLHSVAGALQARASPAAAELRAAIALAARDEAELGRTGLSICLTEPGVEPVFAHVLPMTGSDLRTRLQPEAVAAVFIGAALDAQDGAELLAAAYGLTPAETRVLASLLEGHALPDVAAKLGVAPATARTHLDRIFSKTGVSRQAELIQLAAKVASPAITRSGS